MILLNFEIPAINTTGIFSRNLQKSKQQNFE